MKRGSALLLALIIILVLSVMVVSFSFEARLQRGVNLYVENKAGVTRLIDSGRILGEVILLGYKDAKQWTEDEDLKRELEDDRWFVEKQALKYSKGCTIGPILLDEENPDSGTVKVEIALSSSDEAGGININTLCKDSDPNFEDRWRIILDQCGVNRDLEVKDDKNNAVNLQSYIIACWQDYRDEDDNRYDIHDTSDYDGAQGAEKKEYEEYYDDHRDDYAEEDRFEPQNGEIADMKELSRVLCFQKFPAILTGGPLYPDEKGSRGRSDRKSARKSDKDDEIVIPRGLMNLGVLGVTGDGKVNVNRCTVEQLLTVPGIYQVDELDEDIKTESQNLAQAIVDCRKIPPEDYDLPKDETRTEWGYGEFTSDWWADLTKRVSDYNSELEIPNDAKNYLTALPSDESTLFKMTITAALGETEYKAECECYVKDKKVRYVSWKED